LPHRSVLSVTVSYSRIYSGTQSSVLHKCRVKVVVGVSVKYRLLVSK